MDHLFKCRRLSHHSNGTSILRLEVLKDILDVNPVLSHQSTLPLKGSLIG